MKSEEMLHQALGIDSSWYIARMQNNLGVQQIDIWIAPETPRSGWLFGGSRPPAPQGAEQIWRHINIGQMRCIVHATPPDDPNQHFRAWLGEAEQPFTHALARQVTGMLMAGVSIQTVCALLDIPLAELWHFKHHLDTGKFKLGGLQATAEAGDRPPGTVPEAAHPVWAKLLDSQINLDIRALSLKFFLTRQREQYAAISDSEVRQLKIHEMQHYFIRHEKNLRHELAQINQY